eukprot:TRINITY_DN2780_c1_g1_i1.p3 TRINITY_DN2780_c1_g1~~TRINITY_DN2780_c1_g1_i1.p3  ORF type:complete len:309 (+),score=63.31 TRINITY_DN2780_c1_g1_i1:549-1475(+)
MRGTRRLHDTYRNKSIAWASRAMNEGEEEGEKAGPSPGELFVQLWEHTSLASTKRECFCILELGEFTLHDLIGRCQDLEAEGKPHNLRSGDEIVRVLGHVLRALRYLHSQLFLHGDLKPANIMWFGESWKLIDLDGLLTSSQLLDMRDAEFYTAIYAAPELAGAVAKEALLRVSRGLDVWATGVIALEMDRLAPLLWDKYEACCNGGRTGSANTGGAGTGNGSSSSSSSEGYEGFIEFMTWLSEDPDPVPAPSPARVASPDLLRLIATEMATPDAESRSTPAELLRNPVVAEVLLRERSLPLPVVPPY